MRHVVRNKAKIEQQLGKEVLEKIVQSLSDHDKNEREDFIKTIEGDDLQTIFISDSTHSVNEIAFFIISQKFDVRVLAFKEFIGE